MKLKSLLILVAAFAIASTSVLSAQKVVKYSRWAGGQETAMFQALVDEFNNGIGKTKGITVKFEPLPWGTYWDKLRTTVLSGDAPDVISLSNAGENAAYLTRGVFLALDNFDGAKAAIADLAKPAVQSLTVNGRTMGVPVGLGVRAMIYNKKLLRDAGIPFPDPVKPMTWEYFMEISKKLSKKNASGAYTQITAVFQMGELSDTIAAQMGAEFLNSRTKPTSVTINNATGIQALTFIQNLYKNGVIPADTGEWNSPYGNPDNAVATGKAAFMLSGPWGMPAIKTAGIDFGTCPTPIFAGKEQLRASRGYINGLAIFRSTKVRAEAWEFVKWLISKEGQLSFTKTGDLPANTKALADAQAKAGDLYKSNGTPEQYKAYFAELPYVISGFSLPTSEWQGLYESIMGDLWKLKLTPAQTAAALQKDGDILLSSMWD
jgi:multiple sugar transport system substrate-binding protein